MELCEQWAVTVCCEPTPKPKPRAVLSYSCGQLPQVQGKAAVSANGRPKPGSKANKIMRWWERGGKLEFQWKKHDVWFHFSPSSCCRYACQSHFLLGIGVGLPWNYIGGKQPNIFWVGGHASYGWLGEVFRHFCSLNPQLTTTHGDYVSFCCSCTVVLTVSVVVVL